MSNFAVLGVAGFVAPRHLRAIRETGNELLCAHDVSDSVGILDSYFPRAAFFTDPTRFDRYLEKLRRVEHQTVDYFSICTPNHLHDAQIRYALRTGAQAICEKPLVLNPWNLDALGDFEKEHGGAIHCILQLRLHDSIRALKQQIDQAPDDRIFDVDLTYITSRGQWYFASWKADPEKSGGIATNIGVHFFDMLAWIFGAVEDNKVHLHRDDRAAGLLRLKRANVRWFLSVNEEDLPDPIRAAGQRTYRAIAIDQQEVEFSEGFTDLHTTSYQQILAGKGFGVDDVRSSIEIVSQIRVAETSTLSGDYHPMVKKV